MRRMYRQMYIRWDWETALARLRPLLSITGVLGDPVLPELCLLVRTRPGQHRRAWGEPAGIHKLILCVNSQPWTEGVIWEDRPMKTWMKVAHRHPANTPTSSLTCDDTVTNTHKLLESHFDQTFLCKMGYKHDSELRVWLISHVWD